MTGKNKIIAFIDGGSRGNPGPAALGVVITEQYGINAELYGTKAEQRGAKEYSKFLGNATNNEAEYQAAIFAFKKIKQLIGGEKAEKTLVEIKSDSELLVNQINAKYKIKEKNLIPFFIEIWNLKQDFAEVKFTHIAREGNTRADSLVNRELNSQIGLF